VSIATSIFLPTSCSIDFSYIDFRLVSYFDSRNAIIERVKMDNHARMYYFASITGWLYVRGAHAHFNTLIYPVTQSLFREDMAMAWTDSSFPSSAKVTSGITSQCHSTRSHMATPH
jgi:hypothetical protein